MQGRYTSPRGARPLRSGLYAVVAILSSRGATHALANTITTTPNRRLQTTEVNRKCALAPLHEHCDNLQHTTSWPRAARAANVTRHTPNIPVLPPR
ncbi:hypothetical protein J6590_069330 [Homalodisca vitripennis]|nr:hypothetical protein J6590_069330 [Homalodisca vitripennis]